MPSWYAQREARLRDFFELSAGIELASDVTYSSHSTVAEERLEEFNLEGHVIPSAEAVPFDDAYLERLYPDRSRDFTTPTAQGVSCREAILSGHSRHQGQIIAVETTQKQQFLPHNRQCYGTHYGYDSAADPFKKYIGDAGFTTSSRFGHNYLSLRRFIEHVNDDWRRHDLMPAGYRLTICPPAVFNLIGTVFHPEWSETETLEVGFYRDEHRSAKCYEVGSNKPGDFSYIQAIDSDSEWELLGFRLALLDR